MKDTQGNKITEEEFIEDIGHKTQDSMKTYRIVLQKITEDGKEYKIVADTFSEAYEVLKEIVGGIPSISVVHIMK